MRLDSPWLVLILFAVSFFLGGGLPFSDYEQFQQWVTEHFPQLGAFGFLLPVIWQLLQRLRRRVDADTLRSALQNGDVDIERLGEYSDAVAERIESGAADASFVALFHCCEDDAEVTEALNTAHSLYRTRRAPDTLPLPDRAA